MLATRRSHACSSAPVASCSCFGASRRMYIFVTDLLNTAAGDDAKCPLLLGRRALPFKVYFVKDDRRGFERYEASRSRYCDAGGVGE